MPGTPLRPIPNEPDVGAVSVDDRVYGHVKDGQARDASDALEACTFLPEYFGRHGYKTMGIGKLFHGHAPKGVFEVTGGREGGFGPPPRKRMHWDRDGTSTDWGPYPDSDEEMPDYRSAMRAIERLEEAHDCPFFLAVGFVRPHVPWHVPQEWFDLFNRDDLVVPPYSPMTGRIYPPSHTRWPRFP